MLRSLLLKSKWSFLSFRTVVLLNFVFILGICLYGLLTDEPYWRAVGHGPELYNYLLWAGLVLNGPSGFIADHLLKLIQPNSYNHDWLVEYGLWLLLLWPQWKAYDLAARWCMGDRRRETALYVVIAGITAIGCVMTLRDQARYLHPDSIFLVGRVAAITLSSLVILVYIQFRKGADTA
ncbi:MAG: hypothetical protein ACLQIQ_08680 [Beijerinckiaceae bacterium]